MKPSARWREVPSTRIEEAAALAGDGVLALGGGSAIDLGKAISAKAELPLVSVPTTYSGAEWTTCYGIRDPERKMRGHGAGARPTAIVYDVGLTLDLPRETDGRHCPERARALRGGALRARAQRGGGRARPRGRARSSRTGCREVVERPHDRDARTELLRGACHGGAALGGSMLALGHAMAQAVGGRYGLPHGTLNAICLPAALRYNRRHAPEAIRRFGEAVGGDPVARVEELAALGGSTRLRDLGVPEEDLRELAEAAALRAGNQANPYPATPAEIEELLRSVW